MSLRPLREVTDASDADEALAAKLARSFPAAVATLVPPARATARSRRAGGPLLLRPALVLAVLAIGAVASAMIGGLVHFMARRAPIAPSARATPTGARSEAAPPVEALPDPPPVTPLLEAPHAVVPRPQHTQPAAPASSLAAFDDVPTPAPDVPPASPAVSPKPSPPPPGQTAAPAPAEDFALLADAMRALRRAHDPGAARALVATYLTRHPDGEMVEEALAIRLEAAIAARDPQAKAMATDYLARYPRGRYAAPAHELLAAP